MNVNVNRFYYATDSRNECGAILVLFALCIPVIFFFLALTVDIGVHFSSRYALQTYADASSAAVSDQFSEFDTSTRSYTDMGFRYPWEESHVGLSNQQILDNRIAELADDYRKAKLAPLAVLKVYASQIKGISSSTLQALQQEQITFSTGNFTNIPAAPDYPAHQFDTAVSGNLTISVTRGIRCYIGTQRYFCPIENNQNDWTYANAALVRVTLATPFSFFSRMISPSATTIQARSISYLPETIPPACGIPTCDSLGTNSFSSACVPLSSIQ